MNKFVKGMLIYAVTFLLALAAGLGLFWEYLSAYESSRPEYGVESYLALLTDEMIYDYAEALTAQLDYSLQSEAVSRRIVSEALSEEIYYARNHTETTEQKQVFVLLCGGKTIGTITLSPQNESRFGFTPWQVTEEVFDLFYLLTEPVHITVPPEYTVSVNGKALDEDYITQRDIHYAALAEFYDDYDLPTMVTYEAGPFLAQPQIQVTDAAGNPVEAFDENGFLDNCTETEIAELHVFVDKFIHRYVTYTGSANRNERDDYLALMYCVVYGSELGNRLYDAMLGLGYAQSRGDEVVSITVNRYCNIGNGRYFLDVTYEVDTLGHEGLVRTTSNSKIIVTQTQYGLKAENLASY